MLVMKLEKLIIGSHVSYSKEEQLLGSVKEALSYDETTFMFYTGAPQNTNRLPINKELTEKAYQLMEEKGIDLKNIIVHAPYIINLANEGEKQSFGINFLKQEVKRCEELKIKNIVLHPGSHVGLGREKGLDNIVYALNEVITKDQKTNILLETMAGKGSELGCTLEEIKYIIDNCSFNDKIGVCLDSCHLHDAGYDLSDLDSFIKNFDKLIGLDKIKCVHINDSKNPLGSSKDRHENIGLGYVGFDNLINLIYHPKLKDVPKILETPYVSIEGGKDRTYPPYKFEIKMIRDKKFNASFIDEIREYYK